MTRHRSLLLALALMITAGIDVTPADAQGATPKRGGILTSVIIEDPPGFSIHESATVSTVWPMMPCYSNLVMFDPAKPQETVDTIVPELAERWPWQDGHRNLAFFLRRNVKWHDGKAFTSKDDQVDRWIDLQSQELDKDTRLKLVWQIQKQLEADVARPMLGWREEYVTQWPHVKNLVAHHSLYNWGRMQDVWLDK